MLSGLEPNLTVGIFLVSPSVLLTRSKSGTIPFSSWTSTASWRHVGSGSIASVAFLWESRLEDALLFVSIERSLVPKECLALLRMLGFERIASRLVTPFPYRGSFLLIQVRCIWHILRWTTYIHFGGGDVILFGTCHFRMYTLNFRRFLKEQPGHCECCSWLLWRPRSRHRHRFSVES
jgi:hypothetical protein